MQALRNSIGSVTQRLAITIRDLFHAKPVTRKTNPPGVSSSPNATKDDARLHSVANARVGIVMGSASDWETMRAAAELLREFKVTFEARVLSAHRMPDALFAYAQAASKRGLAAIIAGAGGSAHLPGMLASKTTVPVLGVPVPTRYLHGQDSLYSIVQMPRGIPVATFAIGSGGAANAALFAIAMMAAHDRALAAKLDAWRTAQTQAAGDARLAL